MSLALAISVLRSARSAAVMSSLLGLPIAPYSAVRRFSSGIRRSPSSSRIVPVASPASTLTTMTPAGDVSTSLSVSVSSPSGTASARVSTSTVAKVALAAMVTVPLASA